MVTVPTIHMNGSHPGTLRAGFVAAWEKLAEALHAIAETAPNGRDFYVLENGDAAFRAASAEHHECMRQVREQMARFETLAEAVQR